MLDICTLNAWYLHTQVLFDISLTLAKGEIVWLRGPNGSGKSALIRAMLGLDIRRAGSIILNGEDVSSWPVRRIVMAGLRAVVDHRHVFPDMSVQENLDVATGQLPSPQRTDRYNWIIEQFPILQKRGQQSASTLSGGQQQLLGIALALSMQPRVLLLDEPFIGLDTAHRQSVIDTIMSIHDETAILLAEPTPEIAASICQRGYSMHRGRIEGEFS